MIITYLYDLQINPPKGGNHRHAFELVEGFKAQGHTVRVVNDPTMEGVEHYNADTLSECLQDTDILYVRIDARPLGGSVAEKAMLACKAPIVWEVNAPSNETLAYSWLGGKVDLSPESALRKLRRCIHAWRKRPGIFLEERCRKLLSRRVSAHICVTDALKQYADECLKAKLSITVPNGGALIDIERTGTTDQNETFTVLYSGSSIYPWQGIHFLNEVTKLAEEERDNIVFEFLVPNHPESIAARTNVSVEVGKPYQELLERIKRADLCVALYPDYPWSPWGLHNSPMKLYEYFSMRKATLTSNLGQMKDLFSGKGVTVLSSNDPRDILDNIRRVKNDTALRKMLEDNAYNVVQSEMNWKNVVSKTLHLFEDVRKS